MTMTSVQPRANTEASSGAGLPEVPFGSDVSIECVRLVWGSLSVMVSPSLAATTICGDSSGIRVNVDGSRRGQRTKWYLSVPNWNNGVPP